MARRVVRVTARLQGRSTARLVIRVMDRPAGPVVNQDHPRLRMIRIHGFPRVILSQGKPRTIRTRGTASALVHGNATPGLLGNPALYLIGAYRKILVAQFVLYRRPMGNSGIKSNCG